MKMNIQLFGAEFPPFYKTNDGFYLKEANKTLIAISNKCPNAKKECDYLKECLSHLDGKDETSD